MADRISDLEEGILCHILSFLPTKQAVVTSVLSKRWKSLWRFVPTLDFDDANYVQSQEMYEFNYGNYAQQKEIYAGFVRSVSSVLLLRDCHQRIQKFSLRCSSVEFYDSTYVCKWIHAAVQSRVEHLHLSLPPNWCRRVGLRLSYLHPPHWFWRRDPIIPIVNCSTLVVLKLENLVFQLSSSPHFPSLKILGMNNIGISDDSVLSKFISGCPILENLTLNTILFEYEDRYVPTTDFFPINCTAINCTTLVVLKLENLCIEASSSPHLPSLKILQMRRLMVDDFLYIKKFLSGCPILEELEKNRILSRFQGSSIARLVPIINCSTLVVLKLKNLQMEHPSSPYFPFLKILLMKNLWIYDLLCLSKFLSGCPNLEDLKTKGRIIFCNTSRKGKFEILSKLVRASIREDHVFLLEAVTKAKFLHITEL